MRYWGQVLGWWLAGMLVAGAAWAQQPEFTPRDGLGLMIGQANHDHDAETDGGTTFSYSSTGLSLGADYQFALTDFYSLSFFYQSFGGDVSSDDINGEESSHTVFGAQVRRWFEQLYLGVHYGRYTEELQFENGFTTEGDGPGFGAVIGFEREDGLFFMGQVDYATLEFDATPAFPAFDSDLFGTHLLIGYRFH